MSGLILLPVSLIFPIILEGMCGSISLTLMPSFLYLRNLTELFASIGYTINVIIHLFFCSEKNY